MTAVHDTLPPPFDPHVYRRVNPEVASLSDADALDHYLRQGCADGLIASPLAVREELIARLRDAGSVLEIGPFCRPLLTGPHVAYLDVLDAVQLRERAKQLGMDPAGCPPLIHHVGSLDQVDRQYDAAVSSHAIEHQPDLIRHLEAIARVLEPGGRYFLIVPDKRYCFDHFIAESTIADVLDAWREERQTHPIARVIEHGALTTHNDPQRHWRGDHGDPKPSDRTRRIREALNCSDEARGSYIDVHAWFFTPDAFRDIMALLAELGLSAFDATVYDTPHGRNEFCAVLERRRPARRSPSRKHDLDLIVIQSADPFRYAPMLAITAPTAIEFCRRHGFRYESFVGIKRGIWNWQASFNRIVQLKEMLDAGFAGWALHMDADAWVHDLDFDLPAYLADKDDRAAVFATSGVTGEHWDINDGVALINFAHPHGRALVERWWQAFCGISDERLRTATTWIDEDNDQDLIQRILRTTPEIAQAVHVESMDVLNSRHARFIRQHLRAQTANFDARVRAIAEDVAAVFARDGGSLSLVFPPETRWRGRLTHSPGPEAPLVERPIPSASATPHLLERVIAAWNTTAAGGPVRVPAPNQAGFVDALEGGNRSAILDHLAGIGRSPLAQGFLGGRRQHQRAEDPVFARRLASWTQDKLVSLAEAVGALPTENPEGGPWGENVHRLPAELYRLIAERLAADLTPPEHIGGYLGIAAEPGVVLHLRIIDAIYAAWRLRGIGARHGATRLGEIGGGAGLTAFYARRLGAIDYTLLDTPVMNAVQAYVLSGSTSDAAVCLAGESPKRGGIHILPPDALENLAPGTIDILFMEDNLPALEPDAVLAYLRAAHRIGVGQVLSINQESQHAAHVTRATPFRDLAAEAGWVPAHRHRHWLRVGYVEELFNRA